MGRQQAGTQRAQRTGQLASLKHRISERSRRGTKGATAALSTCRAQREGVPARILGRYVQAGRDHHHAAAVFWWRNEVQGWGQGAMQAAFQQSCEVKCQRGLGVGLKTKHQGTGSSCRVPSGCVSTCPHCQAGNLGCKVHA